MKTKVNYTCPDIDALISRLTDACHNCEHALNHINDERYEDAKSELKDAIWILEDYKGKYRNPIEEIRSANIQLRDNWTDCEDEIKDLNQQIESLQERSEL